jgi:hypothetical protein
MNKTTKTVLIIAAVAVVGYVILFKVPGFGMMPDPQKAK